MLVKFEDWVRTDDMAQDALFSHKHERCELNSKQLTRTIEIWDIHKEFKHEPFFGDTKSERVRFSVKHEIMAATCFEVDKKQVS